MAHWRLSASEWALGEVTTARAVERVAAAGLDGIELNARWPFDPVALRKLLDANGVVASAISPGYSVARDLSHVQDEPRQQGVIHLRRCLEMAQELSAPIVVAGGQRPDRATHHGPAPNRPGSGGQVHFHRSGRRRYA